MRVVEAVWEKRNMGVDTIEIEAEENDSLEDAEKVISETKSEYLVLKIPSTRSDITRLAGKYGYEYIEDMIHLVNNLVPVQMSKVQKRMYDAVPVEKMTEKDMEGLYQEIRQGMFSTDRISNDTFFSAEQAAERYIGWISDELKRGTEFYKYIYKDKIIGFFTLREMENGIFDSFLGGFYRDFRKSGFGSVYKAPDLVRGRNGKKLITSVSSNNIVQVRALLSNGYLPDKINHVFIKHLN